MSQGASHQGPRTYQFDVTVTSKYLVTVEDIQTILKQSGVQAKVVWTNSRVGAPTSTNVKQ
jgi:hypothetical protein